LTTGVRSQIYIYKYLDTGLLFPSAAIFDPIKLTSPALTHAHASAPAKLVVYIYICGVDFMLGNSRTKLPLAGELTYGKCSFR